MKNKMVLEEIKRFENAHKEFTSKIKEEEDKIQVAKNKIDNILKEQRVYTNSCKHTLDDGSTAFKESRYWISDIYTYTDNWTGEEAEGDNGHTQYIKTCQICGKEIEY
jgi:hypothetical protein